MKKFKTWIILMLLLVALPLSAGFTYVSADGIGQIEAPVIQAEEPICPQERCGPTDEELALMLMNYEPEQEESYELIFIDVLGVYVKSTEVDTVLRMIDSVIAPEV